MTRLGSAIVETIRMALDRTDALPPAEADQVFAMLVADIRSRRPVAVSCLSDWSPTEEPPTSPPGGGR